MAMHTELSIYKIAYDLLLLSTTITRNIPRDLKPYIGKEVMQECIAVLMLVARANAAADKSPHLVDLLERVHVIELLMRTLKDLRFISVPQFSASMLLTDSIGKQAAGWKRYTAKATAPAT